MFGLVSVSIGKEGGAREEVAMLDFLRSYSLSDESLPVRQNC